MKNTPNKLVGVRALARLVLCLVSCCLGSSCTVVPSSVVTPGAQGNITQLGGALELTTATATLKIDNRESFKDGSRLIDNGIKAWGLVASLNRYFDSEDATTAATAATEKARIDGANTGARIAADKEIALKTLELEAAEAALPAAP